MKRTGFKNRGSGLSRGSSQLKRTGFLPKKSQKKEDRDAIYFPMAMAWKIENPICQFEGCNRPVKDVHHMAKTLGFNYFRHFMSVCRMHHIWIHAHTALARLMGYLFEDDPRRPLP